MTSRLRRRSSSASSQKLSTFLIDGTTRSISATGESPMGEERSNVATPQGFQPDAAERLPLPAREKLSSAQQAAADAIISGPRQAILGPFVPLLQCPALMERVGAMGEALRFQGILPDLVRELVIILVARETGNQFEWQTHVALARRAGCAEQVIAAIADGRHPHGLEPPYRIAADL